MYEVNKNGLPINRAGTLHSSTDGCTLTFLEVDQAYPKGGHVGDFITLNLCANTLTVKQAIKPQWSIEDIRSAMLQPLDSMFLNDYAAHNPLRIKEYNDAMPRALQQKHLEGFLMFFESSYLSAPYYSEEFKEPHQPHFRLTLTEAGKRSTVLFYWNRYIVDGFIYTLPGNYIDAFDLRFWEANLKPLN